MKRAIALALVLLVAACAFAQVVVYENSAILEWDAITQDANGDPLLPGDTVTYDVYFYDYGSPPLDVQDVGQLTYYGSTTDLSLTVVFPERREWIVGVRGTITDGGGTSGDPSAIAWSIIEGDVDIATMGGPFYYAPLAPTLQPLPPDNLRDQRY
jgi:hypothetical protein